MNMKYNFIIIILGILVLGIPLVSGETYIVEVDDSQITRIMSAEAKIETAMQNVKQNLPEGVDINKAYEEGFISIKGKGNEINELKKDNFVKDIYEQPIYRSMLDTSTEVINATSTWDLKVDNHNLTGKREAVCVIDSGINYEHEAFGSCTMEEIHNGECEKILGGINTYHGNDNITDDSTYHGTHVAGTIAGNGTLKGVAPNANLVVVKALHNNNANSTSVEDGIEYCNDKAEEFNISTISMSLGVPCDNDGCFNNYCDSEATLMSTRINQSIENNISVVIATGNDGEFDKISLPSCMENSIRVSATDNEDNFTVFANRGGNFNDILTAPGLSINAPVNQNNYDTKSGTSMATPHVSGVIAIMNQKNEILERDSLTRYEIVERLNSTGKEIDDIEESEQNYTRVDSFSSVSSLSGPDLELNINNTLIEYNQSDVNVNWTVNNETKIEYSNINITNPENESIYQSEESTGSVNLTNQNLTDIGNYIVKLKAENEFGEKSNKSKGFEVTQVEPPELNITLSEEQIEYNQNLTVNWSIYDDTEITNSSINITNPENESIYNSEELSGSINLTNENLTETGIYNITFNATNEYDRTSSKSKNFTVTKATPELNLTLNGESENKSINTPEKIDINGTVEETDNGTIELLINEEVKEKYQNEVYLEEEINETGEYNITLRHNETERYKEAKETLFIIYTEEEPNITSVEPEEYNFTRPRNESIMINQTSEDPNNISLNYYWYVNGSLNSTKENFTFNAREYNISSYNITLEVSNKLKNVSREWNLTLEPVPPSINNISPSDNYSEKKNSFNVNFTHETREALNRTLNYNWTVKNETSELIDESTEEFYLFNTSSYEIGSYNVTFKAIQEEANNSHSWNMTVLPENDPVYFNETIPDVELEEDETKEWLNLSEYVINKDNDTLSFTMDSSVAEIEVGNDYMANITATSTGDNYTKINVSDGYSWNLSEEFKIDVEESDDNGNGGSSGGSSGGGGIAPPPADTDEEENEAQTTSEVEEEYGEKTYGIAENTISVNTEGDFESIELDLIGIHSNVALRISLQDEDNVSRELEDRIYKEYIFEYENIEPSDVESSRVNFKVERGWVEERNSEAENIGLYRYEEEWEEQNTTLQDETQTHYHYTSTLDGLSRLAIASEEIEEEEIIDREEEPANDTEIEEIEEPSESEQIIMYIISAIASILGIILMLVIFEKKAKKNANRGRLAGEYPEWKENNPNRKTTLQDEKAKLELDAEAWELTQELKESIKKEDWNSAVEKYRSLKNIYEKYPEVYKTDRMKYYNALKETYKELNEK